jgi:hypothetical protein
MRAKKNKVPVKGYVFEYIQSKYGYEEATGLLLPKTMSAYHAVAADTIAGWWKNMEGKTPITIISPYTSKRQLYYIAKFLERAFKAHFLIYMEAKTDAGCEATASINAFCEKYRISETAFPLNTAKQEWRRHKNKLAKADGSINFI